MAFTIKDGVLTEYNGMESVLRLPEGITRIASGAFADQGHLQEVILPEGLVSIERGAFSQCVGLKAIRFPASLEEIGEYAFAGCRKLKRVEFSENLRWIGGDAFRGCKYLDQVKIPEITRVEGGAFCGCRLSQVDFGSREDFSPIVDSNLRLAAARCIICGGKMEETEDHEGMRCTACGRVHRWEELDDWENFVIEDGVCTDGCFPGGTLPDGVRKIRYGAFDDATVGDLEIPDSVTEIGTGAFIWCDFALRIRLPRNLRRLENRVLDGTNLSHLYLPENLEYLGERCLQQNHQLGELEIPDQVRWIGSGALSGCDGLRTLYLGAEVRHIGEHAFRGCDRLEAICLQEKVKTIGNQAFFQCTGLRELKLNEGLIRIGDSAFSLCKNLESVRIPSTVCSVGRFAFSGCDRLKRVYLPRSLEDADLETAFPEIAELEYYDQDAS